MRPLAKSLPLDRSGISLIETMIALSIGTVIMLGLIHVVVDLTKIQSNVQLLAAFQQASTAVNLITSSGANCQLALNGNQIFDPSSATGVGLVVRVPKTGAPLLFEGQIDPTGLVFNSVRLQSLTPADPGTPQGLGKTAYFVNLHIEATKPAKRFMGKPHVSNDLKMYVVVDDTSHVIQACNSSAGGETLPSFSTMRSNCTASGSGIATTVICPAGYSAVKCDGYFQCSDFALPGCSTLAYNNLLALGTGICQSASTNGTVAGCLFAIAICQKI